MLGSPHIQTTPPPRVTFQSCTKFLKDNLRQEQLNEMTLCDSGDIQPCTGGGGDVTVPPQRSAISQNSQESVCKIFML